jgi:hypothetical protein
LNALIADLHERADVLAEGREVEGVRLFERPEQVVDQDVADARE